MKGSCHCGRIAFDVEARLGKVTECNCSYCTRRGSLLWFVPRAQLRLETPDDDLSTYMFNKHAIEHYFCPACGCAPFSYATAPNGVEMAAVNVRCLEGVDVETLGRIPFDGRRL